MRLEAAQRRALLHAPAGWIATGFGAGLSPVAPGTVGSLAALLPWLALRELPWLGVLAVLAFVFSLGTWASNRVSERLGINDPGCIVIDEFVGQWLALLPLLWQPGSAWWLPVGFGLFRLFDVWKPWPVSLADRRVKGGIGVMLDDAIAGAMAAALLAVALLLQGWYAS
jgi:phosphatidylglycerophosphatase A